MQVIFRAGGKHESAGIQMEPDDTSKVRDLVETKMISICLCGGSVIDTEKESREKGKFQSCNENFTLI